MLFIVVKNSSNLKIQQKRIKLKCIHKTGYPVCFKSGIEQYLIIQIRYIANWKEQIIKGYVVFGPFFFLFQNEAKTKGRKEKLQL